LNERSIHFPPCISQEKKRSSESLEDIQPTGKYLVYAGELNQDLDIELLKRFVVHNPDHLLVLAGPVINRQKWFLDQILELQKQPNVKMLGSLPEGAVTQIIRNSEACIMPYMSGTESEIQNLYPQFMHDFLKYEKPVITTFDFGLPYNERMGVKVCLSEKEFLGSIGSIKEVAAGIDRNIIRKYLDSMTCSKKLEQLYQTVNMI
jgi:glycosyltransferase involved in cell wall biosynthesis